MRRSFQFFQIDVFTDKPLSGNPLAVFPDAKGLNSHQMQKIAAEMNLSETTFVFPSTKPEADFDVRIFTPGKEIPFGGHPTLGTAEVLKYLAGDFMPSLCFNMGVGNVPVEWENGFCFMQQPEPEFSSPLPETSLAAEALGLPLESLHATLPVQEVSTGFPALMIPLKDINSVKKIELNLHALKKILRSLDLVYPFCIVSENKDCQVHARSFAPFIGIPEDPATGSVAGALGAYLLHYGILGKDSISISIEQGVEMGRASEIRVEAKRDGGVIGSIRVGGKSQIVIEGQLQL
ncbi:MAG: PhzF family phenazine biosynthesis protein [Candidatus Nitronauta litoralis]|uniref:PhzF family phenazine biosynthesis protein n=1 Tax=Candidatus Nitronauta litoralis TaxID=2705533 RepID=A0A7T0G182_9BACT|nr:MAG: PhzF family phenazine biosynthesis protein [Candidatus Nitronauta litoralis]